MFRQKSVITKRWILCVNLFDEVSCLVCLEIIIFFFLSPLKKSPQMRPSREKVCKSVISLTGHGDPICCVDGRDWMLIKPHRYTVAGIHGIFTISIHASYLNQISFMPTFSSNENKHFILCDSERERKKRNWRLFNCHFFIQRFAFVNSSGSGIVMKNQQFIFLLFLLRRRLFLFLFKMLSKHVYEWVNQKILIK